jgi:hypothetical protein
MPKDEYPDKVVLTVSPPKANAREKSCPIDPSVACVGYGGVVTFKATRASGALTVYVPRPPRSPKVFPGLRKPIFRVPAGTSRTLRVLPRKHQTRQPREYPYAVYCNAYNCFAKGSLPKMMIGP